MGLRDLFFRPASPSQDVNGDEEGNKESSEMYERGGKA